MRGIPRPFRQALGILLLVFGVLFVQHQRAIRIRQARMRPVAQRVIAEPVPSNPEKAPFYTIEVLGTLPSYVNSFPEGINARGQVVGEFQPSPPADRYDSQPRAMRAFLCIDGRMQDLGTLYGGESRATDLNASGQVIGSSDSHPFRWARGAMTDLAPGAESTGGAEAINDAGQVVGTLSRGRGSIRAFLWTSGSLQDLGTLAGEESAAADINASGQVVGHSSIGPSADTRAFLWSEGQMRNLGTLGGRESGANALNDAGVVVGYSRTPGDTATHACRWSDGVLQDLGILPGDSESRANDINASGQVVGYSGWTPTGSSPPPGHAGMRAFLYTDATGMVDLNTRIDAKLGWELSNATAINDTGQIVGAGIRSRTNYAFRLTPKVR
jgi:probable HAF family extracellular repeat protein